MPRAFREGTCGSVVPDVRRCICPAASMWTVVSCHGRLPSRPVAQSLPPLTLKTPANILQQDAIKTSLACSHQQEATHTHTHTACETRTVGVLVDMMHSGNFRPYSACCSAT